MPKRKKRTKKPKLSKLSTIDDLVNESIRTSNSLENEINKVVNKQKNSKRTKRLNRKLEKLSSQNRKVFKRKLTEKIKRKSKRVKSGGKWGALGMIAAGAAIGMGGTHLTEAYTGGDWGGHDLMAYDADGDGQISHSEFDEWATSEHSDIYGDGSGDPENDPKAMMLQQTWESTFTADPENPGHSLYDAGEQGDDEYTSTTPHHYHYLTGDGIDHFYDEGKPGYAYASDDKGYQNVWADGWELGGATVGAAAGIYGAATAGDAEPKPKKKKKKKKADTAPKGPNYSF